MNGIHEVGGSIPPGSTSSFPRDLTAALARRLRTVLLAALAALAMPLFAMAGVAAAEEAAPVGVAIFDFELIDTSLEGQVRGANAAEEARLAGLGEELRRAYAAAPGFAVAEIEPVRQAARARRLYSCRGCDTRLAAEIGADLAVTGTVQKVSNLILNINIRVRDVETGRLVRAASADIRGNTDETWRRGLSWLISNRLELATSE